jgi:hypothetical protein
MNRTHSTKDALLSLASIEALAVLTPVGSGFMMSLRRLIDEDLGVLVELPLAAE